MGKFIVAVIFGGILGLVASWWMGGRVTFDDPDWVFAGVGATLCGLAVLPIPGAVKGTITGAIFGLFACILLGFFFFRTSTWFNNAAVTWGFVILGAIFGGMAGHNIDAEGEDEAEST